MNYVKELNPKNYLNFLSAVSLAIKQSRLLREHPYLHDINKYGNLTGLKLMLRGDTRNGYKFLVNPISLVRYFEYGFCMSHMPAMTKNYLDVSSPRLFPLYYAKQNPDINVSMINPDPDDIQVTAKMIASQKIGNINIHHADLREYCNGLKGPFDVITSISVIEHIFGNYRDVDAVKYMHNCLAPKGYLLITIPLSTNKQFEFEYYPEKSKPYTGVATETKEGKVIFQRLYDEKYIRNELWANLNDSKIEFAWWGEKEKGWYDYFSKKSNSYNRGHDAKAFLDHFKSYSSWSDMPGMGICGIKITKC